MPAFTTIATVGLGVAGVASQVSTANRQGKLSEEQQEALTGQAKFQREAKRIQLNQESVTSRLQRRRLARDERRRRALLITGSEAAGAIGSSSFLGASGALGTSFGQSEARQKQLSRANISISVQQQKAADKATQAGFIQGERERINLQNQANQSLFATGISTINTLDKAGVFNG